MGREVYPDGNREVPPPAQFGNRKFIACGFFVFNRKERKVLARFAKLLLF